MGEVSDFEEEFGKFVCDAEPVRVACVRTLFEKQLSAFKAVRTRELRAEKRDEKFFEGQQWGKP